MLEKPVATISEEEAQLYDRQVSFYSFKFALNLAHVKTYQLDCFRSDYGVSMPKNV